MTLALHIYSSYYSMQISPSLLAFAQTIKKKYAQTKIIKRAVTTPIMSAIFGR